MLLCADAYLTRDDGHRPPVDRAEERYANAPGTPVVGKPVKGEMTIADMPAPDSACYPSEYPGKVESWARSVAENRML